MSALNAIGKPAVLFVWSPRKKTLPRMISGPPSRRERGSKIRRRNPGNEGREQSTVFYSL
jgi:hypothetical protein